MPAERPNLIHVALLDAYPSEAAARAGIREETGSDPAGEYRGIWRMPPPYGTIVHLFATPDVDPEKMAGDGWRGLESAPPGPCDEWTAEELEVIRRMAVAYAAGVRYRSRARWWVAYVLYRIRYTAYGVLWDLRHGGPGDNA